MTDAPFNLFDACILSIIVLSIIVAFFRGFIRELLSLGAWVGAAVITLYLFPHSTDFLTKHVKNEHLAAGIGALGTYIAALIIISLITSIIMRYVKTGMEVGLLDNFLGLIFGAVRGIFIVSLGYLIMTAVISKDNPPEWLKTSFTKAYLQQGADFLVTVAPGYLNDIEGMVKKQTEKAKDNNNDNSNESGYRPQNQQEMNRLIDSNQPQGTDYNHNQ